MRRLLLALPFALVVACGSSSKAPVVPKDDSTTSDGPAAPKKDRPAIVYDLGDVAPDVARKNFEKLLPTWTACYEKAHAANEALGGSLTLTLRTNRDGSVKWVFVKDSDLGDRAIERCVVESVRAANWGEPVDAKEGEIRGKTVGWKNDEDEPVAVDAGRVQPAIDKLRGKISACRADAGAKGKIRATFYVGPKGKPLSVGFAVDDATGEAAADCLQHVLMGATYVNPSQQVTKTTVELP
jgi:hypothetical protein